VDDQIIIADNEDNSHRGTYKLNEIVKQHNMKISTSKTEVLPFSRKNARRVKIVLNNKIIEKILNFN
jgi:hypothetical protein